MSCLRQSLSISLVLPLLFSVAAVDLAKATDVTIEGNSYATDSANFVNVSSLVPGQAHVFDLLLTEQTTNATLGNFLGFCVDLRSDNLNQCQYTLQLAEGTLQLGGLQSFPPGPFYNPLTPALLPITGGTGLYTGAAGYLQQTSLDLGYGPGIPTNGVIIRISY